MAQKTANLDGQRVVIEHSPKGKLTWMDAGKAAIMAGLLPAIDAVKQLLEQLISSGSFHITKGNLQEIATVAGIGVAGYLIKQFGTDTKIISVTDNNQSS